ncbi:hypothetical protein DFH09DRAFT_1381742 [Mycena vulgaris]|nr:hypothetical protein DFH09DRAFT_1297245 [Mycena vulgaris]KAJ6462713.1 hypothetical protein DFH09DRAFT_1382708 [Mycena vulgaris]KAJ6466186.1 hypothetical protein DFH09DRAFT_1381742 [Mycena vulgaris]
MAPPSKNTQEEQDFIKLWMPEFLLRKGRKELEDFWPKMRAAYLSEWPEELRLKLPLQQVVHDPNAEKPPPLTDKQRDRLDAALTERFKKLRNSFYNAYAKIRNQRGGVSRSPVSLAAMLFKARPKTKRRHQVLEVYQMVYKDKIKVALKKSEFDQLNEAAQCRDEDGEWIDDDDDKSKMQRVKDARRTRMQIQRRVVQEQWDAEGDAVREKMREMAQKEVVVPVQEEGEAEENGKTKERAPEAYQMSIDESGPVAEMFLAEFHRMTGWMGVLVYGGPVPRAGGELGVKSVCFGHTPAGLDFQRFHPHWKKGITTPLFRFLRQAIPREVRLSRGIFTGEDQSDIDEDSEESVPITVDGEAATPPKKTKKNKSRDKTDAPVENAETVAVTPSVKPARRPKPKPKAKTMPVASEDEQVEEAEMPMAGSDDAPPIDAALTAPEVEEDLACSEWPDEFDALGGGGETLLSTLDEFAPLGSSPLQFPASPESHRSSSNTFLSPPSNEFASNDFPSQDLLFGLSGSHDFPPSTSEDLHLDFNSSRSHELSRSNPFASQDLAPWNGWTGSLVGDWPASQHGGSAMGSNNYRFPPSFGLPGSNTFTPTDPSILGFAPPFTTPPRPLPRLKVSSGPFSFSREAKYRLDSPTGSTGSVGGSGIGLKTPTPASTSPTDAPAAASTMASPVPSATPRRAAPVLPPPPASTPKRIASTPAKSSPLARPPLQAPAKPAAPSTPPSATPPPSGSLPPRLRPSPIRRAASSGAGALPPPVPPRTPIYPQSRPMANAPKKLVAKLSPGAVAKKMAGVRAAKKTGEKKAGLGKKATAKATRTTVGATAADTMVAGVTVTGAMAVGATVVAATVETEVEVETVRPQEPLPTYSSSNNNARRLQEEKAREVEEKKAAAARKAANMRLHNPAGDHDLFITAARPQRTILPPKNRGAVLSLKEKTAALEAKMKADDEALLGALAAGKKRKAPVGENVAPATKRSKVAKETPASRAAEMGPEAKTKKTAVGRGKRK